jgi:hypothetical protein
MATVFLTERDITIKLRVVQSGDRGNGGQQSTCCSVMGPVAGLAFSRTIVCLLALGTSLGGLISTAFANTRDESAMSVENGGEGVWHYVEKSRFLDADAFSQVQEPMMLGISHKDGMTSFQVRRVQVVACRQIEEDREFQAFTISHEQTMA